MPLHTHPVLRNRELALEAAGLQAPLNSDGYNELINAFNAGLLPEQVPYDRTFYFNNTYYPSTK